MKRILIVGISGTGKSKLAKRISDQTNIPATYCDAISWRPNWEPEEPQIVERALTKELNKKEWIVEGYIQPLASERIRKADIIIYLDLPGYLAFLGGVKRWWKFRGKERPEMQKGNKEDLVPRILWSMLTRKERPEIESYLIDAGKKVIRLKSWRAANKFQL